MVGARSAAMAFNRLVDAEIDARNPRTKIAPHPGRTALARLLPGASRWSAAWCSAVRRLGTESALLPSGAARAGGGLRLFVHQALHAFLAPGAGLRAGDRAGRRLDRGARLARPAHPSGSPPPSRSGPPVSTSSILPGLRFRPRIRPLQRAATSSAFRRPSRSRRRCMRLMIVCLLMLVWQLHLGAMQRRGCRRRRRPADL